MTKCPSYERQTWNMWVQSAREFPAGEGRTCKFHRNAELQMCEFHRLILHQDFQVYFRFGILNVGGKRCLWMVDTVFLCQGVDEYGWGEAKLEI